MIQVFIWIIIELTPTLRHVRVLCALCNDWRDGDEVARGAGVLSSFCCLAEALDVVVGEGGFARRHVRCSCALSPGCAMQILQRRRSVARLLPNGAACGHALTMSETSER